MRSVVQLCLAANNILLMRKWNHASRSFRSKNIVIYLADQSIYSPLTSHDILHNLVQ